VLLPPSEFEPPLLIPLFGELTPSAAVILIVDFLSPLHGSLKLQEPFTTVTDHQSTATAVTPFAATSSLAHRC
jgi:hypothetical protein